MRHDLLDALRNALVKPLVMRRIDAPRLDEEFRLRAAGEDVGDRAIRNHPSHGLRIKAGKEILALGKGIGGHEQIRSSERNDLRVRPERPRAMNAGEYFNQ